VALKVDECDGITMLEGLEMHPNSTVYETALSIIEEFFGVEDEIIQELNS